VSDFGPLSNPIGGESSQPSPLKLSPEGNVCIATKQDRHDRVRLPEQQSTPIYLIQGVLEFGKSP
jgi:hypothetical protein